MFFLEKMLHVSYLLTQTDFFYSCVLFFVLCRVTKPPGGDASDIFGSESPTTTPPTTPRKVKNYLASNIFSAERGDQQPKARPRPEDNSFNRLFGAKDAPDGGSPVRVKNYQKSNIIMNDTPNGKAHTNGEKNGHSSPNGHGSDSGVGSGSVTPNGSTNGDSEPKTSEHKNSPLLKKYIDTFIFGAFHQ